MASATSSSGYDSYHSPHRRCYVLRLHTLRDSRGGLEASSEPPATSTRLTQLTLTRLSGTTTLQGVGVGVGVQASAASAQAGPEHRYL